MSKLKLNIQYFGSTNRTTHYDLSQYVASDKPTYLIDYNQDMAKIDAGIYDAMSKATVNEANIGTMQDLTTSAKSSLVLAINEINTQLGTNTTNIGINTSNIATLGTNQGDLVNLMTVAKNNLVSAINELKGVNDTQATDINSLKSEIERFNLSSINTYTDSASGAVLSSNIAFAGGGITFATDSTSSVFKLYGRYDFSASASGPVSIKIPTSLRPTSEYNITPIGFEFSRDSNGVFVNVTAKVKTNGEIEITAYAYGTGNLTLLLFPCLYFNSDFGDTPVNS
mgnify:CR=1 FL=1